MKGNTLKIKTENKEIELIKFKLTEEELKDFDFQGYKRIDIIGKCDINTWGYKQTPQIIIEDYEIINACNFVF